MALECVNRPLIWGLFVKACDGAIGVYVETILICD